MSKKFKSQASSARVASNTAGFGSFQSTSSPLSYITELPDLSQVPDSNVVVAFKNLGKKDSTTKEKALDDLQQSLRETVDVSTLSAWSEIYPRTSIDNSRRVRVSAHTLQGSLTVSSGKKIVPFLPKIVGSWLAGTFDGDRIVAKSAQDALEKAFPTENKRKALWSVYRDAILDHIRDSTTIQTASTLSDERTTSQDDAQAKYVRVAGTGLYLLGRWLRDGSETDLLQERKLWEFVYHPDPYLRNATCSLTLASLEKSSNELDWEVISRCFLYEGLRKDQTGSTRQFSETLLKLTRKRPELWTTDYTAKTSVSKRALHYFRQGSQNGPADVWSNISSLVKEIPEEALFGKSSQSSEVSEAVSAVAEAVKAGVNAERIHGNAAWTSYVQICLWLLNKLQKDDEKQDFIGKQLIPIIIQYVTRGSEQQWTVSGNAARISTAIILGVLKLKLSSTFQQIWQSLVNNTIEKMKLSLPASSKEFRNSQDTVITQVQRLYDLKTLAIKSSDASSSFQDLTATSDQELLLSSLDLLKSRNGNPYSAAASAEILAGQGLENDPMLQDFLNKELAHLIDTPSCAYLVGLGLECGRPMLPVLLEQKPSSNINDGLVSVLRRSAVLDLEDEKTQSLVLERFGDFTGDDERSLAISIFENSALSAQPIQSQILRMIIENLSASSKQEGAIVLLEDLISRPTTYKAVDTGNYRSELISKLLIIGDADSPFAQKASSLSQKLQSGSDQKTTSQILKQQLDGQGTPLTVITLLELGKGCLESTGLNEILPTASQWEKALHPHLMKPTETDLVITSSLQGTIWCLDSSSSNGSEVVRDTEEFSLLFRQAYYVTKLLKDQNLQGLDKSILDAMYLNYPVALQLINEKVTLDDANDIWLGSTPEVLHEAAEILSEGAVLVKSMFNQDVLLQIWLAEGRSVQETSRKDFLKASTFVNLAGQHVDEHGSSQMIQEFEEELKQLHRSNNVVQSAALLATLREHLKSSSQGKKMCNELVANATETNVKLETLVLLNLLVDGDSTSLDHIPQQRVVFLLKNLIHILEEGMSAAIICETFKLLSAILPLTLEIYGEHWEQMLQALKGLWNGDVHDLPLLHSSLRLYAKLKSLRTAEDINEDFEEAWVSLKPELDHGLLSCLQIFTKPSFGVNQPRTITAELLRRQLSNVQLTDNMDVYALLSSSERAIQTTAYELLHRAIPERQEQLSMELALEKTPAHLPEELVALLTAKPDARQYLLSWKLVFDHFPRASHMLREMYIEDIKSSDHLNNLLQFICENLRIVDNRPVDASKFNVTEYHVDEAESKDKDIQWLTINNYYSCLLYVPGLTKEWFIHQLNRVKLPLEKWTKQHISPLIVAASLVTVTEWATTQSQDEADRPVSIKASPKGSELVASIQVDPESPSISLAITLPASYPLESPVVTSRERVGVSDKNWKSWMRTFQIIIFTSGSIIEGLTAFRRNVLLALEGQKECAICYSIIGTDMKTPDKKCGTCKNMFHAICLYRWFKSSNSSSCPLCRNNFNYA